MSAHTQIVLLMLLMDWSGRNSGPRSVASTMRTESDEPSLLDGGFTTTGGFDDDDDWMTAYIQAGGTVEE